MRKLGINGVEESEIGVFLDRFGWVINVQLIKYLLKVKILWKEVIDG